MVVWCHDQGRQCEVGLRFLNEADAYAARMVEQICHIEHYKANVRRKEGRLISGEQAAKEWIEKFAENFPQEINHQRTSCM